MTNETKQLIKVAIEKHEQAFGSICWSNGKAGLRELPNELDGVLLKEIVGIIENASNPTMATGVKPQPPEAIFYLDGQEYRSKPNN